MISQGIALKDCAAVLETPTGRGYAQEHVVQMELPQGALLFVPFGWQPMGVFAPMVEARTKGRSRPKPIGQVDS